MVFIFKIGVVYKLVPMPPANTVPPLAAAYQSTVVPPAAPVTLKFTVPVLHLLAPTATKSLLGNGLIVASTGILVELTHPVVLFLTSA